MLSRRFLAAASRLPRPIPRSQSTLRVAFLSTSSPFRAQEAAKDAAFDPEIDDPEMNGGYQNPPPIKRQHRDPYGDWWDKQERRNFGEPVHEDNDILGIFALEDYTHMTPGRGLLMWSGFITCVLGLSYAVYVTYPDLPSAPKEYEDGLEAELGGKGAVRAWKKGDEL